MRPALIAAGLALALAGCGDDTKRLLGWDRSGPDEFQVVTRAPLAQPPDFDLRPPTPGAARPQEGTSTDQARRALVGGALAGQGGAASGQEASTDMAGLSIGEQALLRKTGGDKASTSIRREVDEESTALVEANQSFTDELLFWQSKPAPGEILDPEKEAKRLENNASLGKPPTEGATPQIVREQKGWLEGTF